MEKITSEKCWEVLHKVWKDAINGIKQMLKEKNISSINIAPYINDSVICSYSFFDNDKDGYGQSYTIDGIELKNGEVNLIMFNYNYDYSETWQIANLSAVEATYLLEMLEEIFKVADEDYKGQVVTDFDKDLDDLAEELGL